MKLLNTNGDDGEAENTSSVQIVASIDGLLIEILQRLPLKPLAQLKLVSNHWNSLISDPKLYFLRNRPAVGLIFEGLRIGHGYIHDTSNHPHSYIIFLNKSISPPFRKITPVEDPWYRHCEILHSCNGLLVCASNRAHNLSRKYYVCNPTTRKYSALPQVLLEHGRVSKPVIRGMYLAFDPSKSPHYKVVCVLGLLGSWSYLFEVYSSEMGSWRKGGELFTANDDFDFEDGVYWNGAMHWVNIVTRPWVHIVTKPRESIYFNLDCDKTPKVFPMPPLQDGHYDRHEYYFGESCDHLHFVDSYRMVSEFNVYEMKRNYSEWFVKYKVNVPDARFLYRCTVVRGKNDEDSFLVFVIGERIARYNFEQKTCEILCDFEPTDIGRPVSSGAFSGAKRSFQYIESLSSVQLALMCSNGTTEHGYSDSRSRLMCGTRIF